MKIDRRTLLVGSSLVSVGSVFSPRIAKAAPRIIKLGHNSVASSQFGIGCQALSDAVGVHPDLKDILKVDVRGNAELGDDASMLESVRNSTIDMMAAVTLIASKACPEIGMLDVPFVFKDVERGRAAFAGEMGQDYSALLKAQNINVVGWLENGLRHITSKRPVRVPADIQGLKLRVPPSQIAIDSFTQIGADAKPLGFNALYEALRTGQFEAQENPVTTAVDIKLWEVQKYLCLSGHTYSVGFVLVSPDLVEDLTPKQFAALVDCARAGTRKTIESADAAAKSGIGTVTAAGMIVVDDVDKAAFSRAARPNLDRLSAKFGSDRVERLLKAAG